MQYFGPPGAGNQVGPNMERLASASSQAVLSSGGTAWTYWDLRSSTFNLGNDFLDYPDISVGDNYLYISATVLSQGLGQGRLVMRIPLNQIQAGGSINIEYTNPLDSTNATGAHLTQDTGNAVFWAGHQSTSQMRIWKIAEGSSFYSWTDVNINSWPMSGNGVSLTPISKIDWLSWIFANNGLPRTGCIGAARRFPGGPSEIWFAWSAPAGSGFPNPHIQMVALDDSTFSLLQQVQVWNPSFAFAYPCLVANSAQEIGMAVGFGGGPYEASSAVGIWGDFIVWTPGFSTGFNDRYGDFLTVRRYPRAGVYDASIYNIVDLGNGETFNPFYIRFGRQSVSP
jgi:hypothetical protein